MKIDSRIRNVKGLLTQTLQDFFKLECTRLYSNGDWKAAFCNCIWNPRAEKVDSYAVARKKMNEIGIDNYRVEDMDAAIILTVLDDWGWRRKEDGTPKINASLGTLRYDRNEESHPSFSEPDSELRELAYGILHDIRRFIRALQESGLYSGYDFEVFQRDCLGSISIMLETLDSDYAEQVRTEERLAGIPRDITEIKKSRDPVQSWYRFENEKYFNSAYIADGTYLKFLQAGADADISPAYNAIAGFYFRGLKGFAVAPDYEKAAKYYLILRERNGLSVEGDLNLAGLFINNLVPGHSPEEGQHILESYSGRYAKYQIDGYIFFHPVPQNKK